MQLSGGLLAALAIEDYLLLMFEKIAACEVANRFGRLEPRVLKRRRHRPVQVLWIYMTTAVFLGMTLTFEPKEAGIMKRRPRNSSSRCSRVS